MAAENKDLRLAPISNIIEVKKQGDHGTILIGIDVKTAIDFMAGKKFAGGLILADKEQFDEIERRGVE